MGIKWNCSMLKIKLLFFIGTCCLFSCKNGELSVIADLPVSLNEVSGVETLKNSELLWVIEDSGNKNHVYGLNSKGSIIRDIKITNAKNRDWEDLTSDNLGNIYIGDFGNNSFNRKKFTIYKVSDLKSNSTNAESISFTLPKKLRYNDFEAFFLFKKHFYIFSKSDGKGIMVKVPNQTGNHIAEYVTSFNLKGKNNKITSADISKNCKAIVLLNHESVWKITNFESDEFFSGKIKKLNLDHNSQKEGVCFKTDSELFITDERTGKLNGNIYLFN